MTWRNSMSLMRQSNIIWGGGKNLFTWIPLSLQYKFILALNNKSILSKGVKCRWMFDNDIGTISEHCMKLCTLLIGAWKECYTLCLNKSHLALSRQVWCVNAFCFSVYRRKQCNEGSGFPPIYVNVNMKSGEVLNNWIDALQAAWPGIQVRAGAAFGCKRRQGISCWVTTVFCYVHTLIITGFNGLLNCTSGFLYHN